jgi:hypothetical protein
MLAEILELTLFSLIFPATKIFWHHLSTLFLHLQIFDHTQSPSYSVHFSSSAIL